MTEAPISHRRVLKIALPIILSSLSTPLLGLVDTAVIGRLPDPAFLGAIAVGAMIFSFVYWAFGFLRMGTTGLTAQAQGAGNLDELRACLGRALVIGAGVGAVLTALQIPIGWAAFHFLDASAQVESLASDYFAIRIWSAPFTLMNYALLGWFIGRERADLALWLQLVLNGLNIALDVTFVQGFGWDVQGVAAGTLLAETLACVFGLGVAARELKRLGGRWSRERLLDAAEVARTFAVNRDIMLRSLCLLFAFAWFTAKGAEQGDAVLATNTVLMQFVTFSAFLLDGFAFAAEALVGGAVGARRADRFRRAVALSTLWSAGTALAVTLVLFVAGPFLIDLLTVSPEVRELGREFLPWAAVAPIAAIWCFQLDGIFIGATRSAEMRNAMALSLLIYLGAWAVLAPAWGNHGLWAALTLFYLARALSLLAYVPRLMRGLAPLSAAGKIS